MTHYDDYYYWAPFSTADCEFTLESVESRVAERLQPAKFMKDVKVMAFWSDPDNNMVGINVLYDLDERRWALHALSTGETPDDVISELLYEDDC